MLFVEYIYTVMAGIPNLGGDFFSNMISYS